MKFIFHCFLCELFENSLTTILYLKNLMINFYEKFLFKKAVSNKLTAFKNFLVCSNWQDKLQH